MVEIRLVSAIDGLLEGSQADRQDIDITLAAVAAVYAGRAADEVAICDEATFGQVAGADGEPEAAIVTDANGRPLTNGEVAFRLAGTAVAIKLNDPTEDARWIFDAEEARGIAADDPSLIVWVRR